MKKELNENDLKLLAFCENERKSVGEVAKYLEIASKNVSVRIKKLCDLKLIKITLPSKGRKTFIRTIAGDKTSKYFLVILNELQQRGGEVSLDEFMKYLPFKLEGAKSEDKFAAPFKLLYSFPPLVEHRIKMTEEGKTYLKKHKTKSSL